MTEERVHAEDKKDDADDESQPGVCTGCGCRGDEWARAGAPRPGAHQSPRRAFVVATENPIDNDGPQPFPVATRITVTGGKVTAMQQYRDDRSVADT